MSLQTIIDKAQTIEIDRRRVVGQTISRSQRIKTAERATAQPWKFTVTPPAYLKWADSRGVIEVIDLGDRVEEYEISLSNTAGMNYITEYRGDLNSTQLAALTIQTASTASMTITGMPDIASTITNRTYAMTAVSFSEVSNATYNRALSTARTDFLITNAEFDANYYSIRPGDTLSVPTYITGSQTISSITRNYFTLNGVGYTRIVMSAAASANSTVASTDGSQNVLVTSTFETYVSSSTVVFNIGDIIQPANSRYPYTVTEPVVRGVNTTTNVSLNRNVITSEGVTLAGQALSVGNDCTWRVVVSGLPTYQLTPMQLVQYTGNFELIERIV
jgi:hypothetical protein